MCHIRSRAGRARAVRALAVAVLLLGTAACAGSGAPPPDAGPPDAGPPGASTGGVAAWSAAMADARHSSATSAIGPATGAVRWRRQLEGNVTPGPAVGADGTVYAASNAGILHALDPATGRDRWTFDGGGGYGDDLSTTPAVLADGRILWPGPHDTLYALTGAGRLLWTETFAGFVLSPAVATDGRVYVADASGALRRLGIGSGAAHRRVWTVQLGDGGSYASPAVAPDGEVVGAVGRTVVAVRDDGDHASIMWTFAAGDTVEVSPAVTPAGTVVVGANDPFEYGLDPAGHVLWRYRKDAWTYSSPVATPDGRVWFGDHRGVLDVVDGVTGAVLARYRPVAEDAGHSPGSLGVWTAPAVDGRGDVYWGTVSGHVYGYSAEGRARIDIDTGGIVDSYPALGADGTLYVGSASGALYAMHG